MTIEEAHITVLLYKHLQELNHPRSQRDQDNAKVFIDMACAGRCDYSKALVEQYCSGDEVSAAKKYEEGILVLAGLVGSFR